ncbi:unnamed protein product [Linum tenue]|uniref:Uncharacterized protein n=1 Tax=Linum tenue TaxID=586396 RepID=A0AAV0RZ92_9ROSI|nr:unnamed protein product [Linum tenue]
MQELLSSTSCGNHVPISVPPAERKRRAEEAQQSATANGSAADNNRGPVLPASGGGDQETIPPNNILFIQNLPHGTTSMIDVACLVPAVPRAGSRKSGWWKLSLALHSLNSKTTTSSHPWPCRHFKGSKSLLKTQWPSVLPRSSRVACLLLVICGLRRVMLTKPGLLKLS